jgi:hypothetical protein
MTTGIRKAAFQAPQPPPAKAITNNPAERLEAMYRRIWLASMRDLPFVNLALSVEAVGFRRWLAAASASRLERESGAGAGVGLRHLSTLCGQWRTQPRRHAW